jgi:hypothetical protein
VISITVLYTILTQVFHDIPRGDNLLTLLLCSTGPDWFLTGPRDTNLVVQRTPIKLKLNKARVIFDIPQVAEHNPPRFERE